MAGSRSLERRTKVLISNRIDHFIKTAARNENSKTVKLLPGLQEILHGQSMFNRILWTAVLILSLTICIYQVHDRISYFASEPIAVDVRLDQVVKDYWPDLFLCTRSTSKFYDHMDYLVDNNLTARYKICGPVVHDKYFMPTPHVSDSMSYWKLLNATDVIRDVYFTKNGTRKSVSLKNVNHLLGICTNIHNDELTPFGDDSIKMHLEFDYPKEKSPGCQSPSMMSSIQVKGRNYYEPSSIYNIYPFSKTEIRLTVSKYFFLNTSKSPCIDIESFNKCEEGCSNSFLPDLENCRFPFMQRRHLPYCKITKKTNEQFQHVMKIANNYNPTINCHCPRVCEKMVIEGAINNDISSKEHGLDIYVNSNLIRTMNERYAYDFIWLVCDVGGNLGLYLGLSILTVLEMTTFLTTKFTKLIIRPEDEKLKTTSMIYWRRQILRMVKKEMKKRNEMKADEDMQFPIIGIQHIIKRENLLKRWIWIFIIVVSVIICSYQTYDRFSYFFQYPVRIFIEVKEDLDIYLPAVVSCSESRELRNRKEEIANIRNISCDRVDFLELLDFSNSTSLEQLWEETDLINRYVDEKKISYMKFGSRSRFDTIFGACTKFYTDKQTFIILV